MIAKVILALTVLSLSLALPFAVPEMAYAQTAQSQKPILTTLHSFDGPHGARGALLTLGTDGNFYGTSGGGINDFLGNGYGTMFRLTPNGIFTTLWRFNKDTGTYPGELLAAGDKGLFYCATTQDGSGQGGTVFSMTQQGHLSTLHAFNYNVALDQGAIPGSNLLKGSDGALYGTTQAGGIGQNGIVFRLTPDGIYSVLHRFDGTLGSDPATHIVLGADGAIYGTTLYGGKNYSGVLFRLTIQGAYSVLHSFDFPHGTFPFGLTNGPDGALYGVTCTGGSQSGGTIYKITLLGAFTTLHAFSKDGHGTYPLSSLILGPDGLFYGATRQGGTNNQGTLFRMTPSGQVTTLYKFHTAFDGYYPGNLLFGPDGALYGSTSYGGSKGYGTIFKMTLP